MYFLLQNFVMGAPTAMYIVNWTSSPSLSILNCYVHFFTLMTEYLSNVWRNDNNIHVRCTAAKYKTRQQVVCPTRPASNDMTIKNPHRRRAKKRRNMLRTASLSWQHWWSSWKADDAERGKWYKRMIWWLPLTHKAFSCLENREFGPLGQSRENGTWQRSAWCLDLFTLTHMFRPS
jgi:hypothetical protein